jgi:hypothetical protein
MMSFPGQLSGFTSNCPFSCSEINFSICSNLQHLAGTNLH